MYHITAAIGIKKGINQRWITVNHLTEKVKDLFQDYRKVILTIVQTGDSPNEYAELSQLTSRYSQFEGHLSDMLIDNGDTALITSLTRPVIHPKSALYSDARLASYKVKPWNRTYGENVHPDDRGDALLTRALPVTDYNYFKKRGMVSVNGFYHMIDTNGRDGIVVHDAMRNVKKSKQANIGLLSFANVCDIEYIPVTPTMCKTRLTPEMISGTALQEPFSVSGYLKVGRDLQNKTVFLVIGGYLHTHDSELVKRVSDDEFKIDFLNYPLLDRYFESNRFLDMSSLGLSTDIRNPTQVAVAELLGDDALKKYLTHPQTFFVVLDTKVAYTARQYIKRTNMPGMYVSYTEPKFPLVTGVGRMPEYWSTHEDGQWSVTVHESIRDRQVYKTLDPYAQRSVTGDNFCVDPEILGAGYFLEIGIDMTE
jgi:hypothetical protein